MKKLLFMIFIVIIMGTFSCQQKNEIEIIKPVKDNYPMVEKLMYSSHPELNDLINSTIDKVREMLGKVNFRRNERPIIFKYFLYINEKGKVDKMIVLGSVSEKIDKFLAKEVNNWTLDVMLENKRIKYISEWEFGFYWDGNKYIRLNNYKRDNISTSFNNEKNYFVAVEDMPSPIGGIKAIQEKIHYPEIAKRAGIEGRVYIKAYIDEKGNVAKAEIIKGLDGGCNEEAIAAVKSTKFIPGRQKGKPVKVQVSIPILFKLDSKKENNKK